jgi:hypothetical protein
LLSIVLFNDVIEEVDNVLDNCCLLVLILFIIEVVALRLMPVRWSANELLLISSCLFISDAIDDENEEISCSCLLIKVAVSVPDVDSNNSSISGSF